MLSEERIRYVTASEVASLFGVSPYKSRHMLWQEKSGISKIEIDDEVTFRGKALESGVLAYTQKNIADGMGLKVESFKDAFFKRDDERVGATPDAFMVLNEDALILIEAKTVFGKEFDSWNGEIPDHYMLQCQMQLLCVPQARYAFLAILATRSTAPGVDFHYYKIERDNEIMAMIIGEAASFWQSVESGIPPAMDYAHDIAIYNETAWFKKDGVIDLSTNNEAVAILSNFKAFERHVDASEQFLLDAVKGDEGLSEIVSNMKAVSPASIEKKMKEFKYSLVEKMGNVGVANINGTKISASVVKVAASAREASQYTKFTIKG